MDEVFSKAGPRLDQLKACTPSYYNFEGNLPANAVQNELYGLVPLAYFQMLADWRADGLMRGLELGYPSKAEDRSDVLAEQET